MQVRNFMSGEKDRRDVLHDQIEAIEQHADEIANLILARDWEPARADEWADVRRCCKEIGEILHRARWAAMWELCELYRDATIEDNIRSNVEELQRLYDEDSENEES